MDRRPKSRRDDRQIRRYIIEMAWQDISWLAVNLKMADSETSQASKSIPTRQDRLRVRLLADWSLRYPDAYHTCYTLAGLSGTQYHNYYNNESRYDGVATLHDAFQWASSPHWSTAEMRNEAEINIPENRLTPIHPIFVIPWPAVEKAESWFQKRGSF